MFSVQEDLDTINHWLDEFTWAMEVLTSREADWIIKVVNVGGNPSNSEHLIKIQTALESYIDGRRFFLSEGSDFPERAENVGLCIEATRERIREIILNTTGSAFADLNPHSLLVAISRPEKVVRHA